MQEGNTVVLVDVPDQAFTDDFGKATSNLHSHADRACLNKMALR